MPPATAVDPNGPKRPVRAAALPWVRLWIVAALVFASSAGSLEAYMRAQGFRPTVPDSKDLWHFWRQCADRDDGKVVVLLGTSRIRADISLPVLEHELGMPAVQLGVDGPKSPIGILRDLAADPGFQGVVVCSLFVPFLDRSKWPDCDDFLAYRPEGIAPYADRLLVLRAHSLFALVNEKLSLRSLVRGWIESGRPLPSVPAAVVGFDRSLCMWSTEANPILGDEARRARQQFLGWRIPKFDELTSACDEVSSFVRRIRSRGGDVLFIHLPSSGDQLADEEKMIPRSRYWDLFAKRVGARCLYVRDFAALRGYACPDGVHLSDRDRTPFTKALATEIKRGEFGRRANGGSRE